MEVHLWQPNFRSFKFYSFLQFQDTRVYRLYRISPMFNTMNWYSEFEKRKDVKTLPSLRVSYHVEHTTKSYKAS